MWSPPTSFGPIDAVEDLTSADKMIAELKALVGPSVPKSAFVDLVRATADPAPDGKAWTAAKVGESVDRLVRKRVLAADGAPAPGWGETLLLQALARPGGSDLIRRVRAAAPRSFRDVRVSNSRYVPLDKDVDLARSARLAALLGDEDEVLRLRRRVEHDLYDRGGANAADLLLLGGCPADLGYLESLPAGLRERIAATHLELLLDHGVLGEGVAQMIGGLDSRADGWPPMLRLDEALLRMDILRERPEAARARMERVRAARPDLAAAAEATLGFLAGDPEGPKLFREALKLHRKAVGRRNIVLPAEFALFHLLALFGAGDIALHREIETQIGWLSDTSPITACAFAALLELVAGRDGRAQQLARQVESRPAAWRGWESPVDTAAVTLALAVVGADHAAAREPGDGRAIAHWGYIARLPARILAEAHAHRPSNAGDWGRMLEALGPGLGRRFIDLVPIRPQWARALDRLEGFMAPPAAAKDPAAAPTRRLVFLLDATTGEVDVLEQSAKRQGWTPGRAVALKRLHQRDPKLDYLTDEDHKVLGSIRVERSYYSEDYAFDSAKAALALIGHPRVFDAAAPDRRVELVGYPVELVVREEGGRIRVDLSHRAQEPRVFIEPETPSRWRVVEVTSALAELAEILGPEGLTAPAEARDRVLGLIRSETPRLPVRAEIEGVASDAIEGEARPIFQIVRLEGGFELRAVVRPMGEAGPAYTPGVGSRSVLVTADAGRRRINRDLARESEALEAAAGACPSLAPWRESDWVWRIDAIGPALEALQELHACEPAVGLEWPEGAAIRPTRTVGSQAVSLSISSARDWFEIKGEIRVDEDLVLDMADVLARLGSASGRFVALDDGRWLALTEDLRRQLEAFAAMTEETKGGRRIGAAGALAVEELLETVGAVEADKRWIELNERLAAAMGHEPELPAGLQAELRDYQVQGFKWLARLSRLQLGACLADDMGLGKTLQALALLLADAARGPSLVVAPTSVCHNWMLEAARFAPSLGVRLLSARPDRRAMVEELGPGDLLVVSYGLLHTEADLLASRRFSVAVFDEAQNLKNAETRRAQAGKRIQADFRLALSGTPVENRLDELWSLYDTVTPGLLGSRESFQRRFVGPIEKGRSGLARQALKGLVRPYLLRRTKAAVLTELPARTEIELEIEPGAEERAFYEAMRRKALETLEGAEGSPGQKRIRILAEITRLRRAACNPVLIDPASGVASAKLAAMLGLAAELKANRHRALVFSQFTGHLDLVEAALRAAGLRLLRLDGSTPARERAARVEAFQAGEGDLFLISLKAGGTGLNLTAADYVIHLDPWWNPAVEDQATDRAHRIGQTRPVTVYRLIAKDSIEEKILALHASKRELAADLLDGAETTAALGEEELMALIRG